MKKFMVAILLGTLLSCLMAAPAAAGSITVNNNTNKEISMAFVYWHPEYQAWVMDAWFKVGAGLSRKIQNPVGGTFYWYGEAWVDGKRFFWPNQKNQHKFWTVVSAKMFGASTTKFPGKNPRKVGFKEVRSQTGCQTNCNYTVTLK